MITWLLGLTSVIIISAISLVGVLVLWLKDQQLKKILLGWNDEAGAAMWDSSPKWETLDHHCPGTLPPVVENQM